MKPAILSSRNRRVLLAALVPLLALAACRAEGGSGAAGRSGAGDVEELGIYTSLPILWGESDDIRGFLGGESPQHWARGVLPSGSSLVPLDSLADANGALPLPKRFVLLLAQPRPLMPEENVALDDWVRGGGRVLLFVDPMLTAPSIFALGDARRPQDVAMLSPILGRWGLVLEFDEAQESGERQIALPEGRVPVNLSGRFRLTGKSGNGISRCSLEAEGLLADCNVGAGRVVALADAALFEDSRNPKDAQARAALLKNLLRRAAAGK